MEENENIEELENIEEVPEEPETPSGVLTSEDIELIREIVEGDTENETETDTEIIETDTEIIIPIGDADNPCVVDFSEVISFLESKGYVTNQDLLEYQEEEKGSIMTKSLDDYTVTEGLLLILCVLFGLFICGGSMWKGWQKWK